MPRNAVIYLQNWLTETARKPLIIRGARQVGKTHSVRELAMLSNKTLIEFNFEKNPKHLSLFKGNDVTQILHHLEAHLNHSIEPNQCILFLDEIQVASELLAKLRWFAEDMPNLPVVAAGSLLDFVLEEHHFSMPVGRITYLYMEPFSFDEFLMVLEKTKLLHFLQKFTFPDEIPEALHQQLKSLFNEYLIIGGMPAAVYQWKEKASFSEVNRIHFDLLSTYRDDFAKYASKASLARIEDIFTSVPRLLGNKFVYRNVNADVQAANLKMAIKLLAQARICHKIDATAGNGLPLAAERQDKYFKMIFLDVGLVSAMLGINLTQLTQTEDLLLINKGALAEQVVGQLLRSIEPLYIDPELFYWTRTEKNSNAEVDYVIQQQHYVLPIEVKAGTTGTLKSLHLFMHHKQLQKAVRFNMDLPSTLQVNNKTQAGEDVYYQLISLPLYMVGQLHRLLQSV